MASHRGHGHPPEEPARAAGRRGTPSALRSPAVLASGILLLATLLHGCMTSYAPGAEGASVVDRWTGEVCVAMACWDGGRQTAPAPMPPPTLDDR